MFDKLNVHLLSTAKDRSRQMFRDILSTGLNLRFLERGWAYFFRISVLGCHVEVGVQDIKSAWRSI